VKNLYLYGRALLLLETVNKKQLTEEQIGEIAKSSIYQDLKDNGDILINEYQIWYFKSLRVVKQLAPERLSEFINLYKPHKEPKSIDYSTYSIYDYLNNLQVTKANGKIVDSYSAFSSKFLNQLGIVNSIHTTIDSLIIDIEGTIQSAFFDSEIKVAEDLLRKKHLRASGAICGVVLEKHFASVCDNHEIKFRKKNPTIDDYNNELKNNKLIDIPVWRHIQHLGDIRNLCVHKKDREPTADEIEDLIRGCKKFIAELY
jgi:hypothetical protein